MVQSSRDEQTVHGWAGQQLHVWKTTEFPYLGGSWWGAATAEAQLTVHSWAGTTAGGNRQILSETE